jgi:hypothetical protein
VQWPVTSSTNANVEDDHHDPEHCTQHTNISPPTPISLKSFISSLFRMRMYMNPIEFRPIPPVHDLQRLPTTKPSNLTITSPPALPPRTPIHTPATHTSATDIALLPQITHQPFCHHFPPLRSAPPLPHPLLPQTLSHPAQRLQPLLAQYFYLFIPCSTALDSASPAIRSNALVSSSLSSSFPFRRPGAAKRASSRDKHPVRFAITYHLMLFRNPVPVRI